MTLLEKRVRAGLEAEARAIASVAPTAPRRRKTRISGAGIALAAAALVFVIFGGAAILTGGDEGQVSGDATTPPSVPSTVTSVNPDGPFEAVPFAGESWQFTVAEGANPPTETFKVCFRFDPPGPGSDRSGIGPSGCGDWPTDDPGYLIGVDQALWTDTGVVLLIDLTDNPVDQVSITGEGIEQTITPFVLPGSGKQFAVVEVPDTAGGVTIEALDEAGAVLDRAEDVDVSSAMRVATMMGGEPLTDEELERFTGLPTDMTYSGYLIESTTALGGAYELGLVVYQKELPSEDGPLICFSPFAITQDVNVGGGATCADNQEKAEELASFHLSMSGSCGGIPKEEPVVDGIWVTLAVWGIPETAETVTVELADGTTVDVDARDGVALHLWEESVDITSIEFADMSREQRDLMSSYMPVEGIGSDCGRGDTGGG